VKILSLWQPWASLWVAGEKVIETRDWGTSYRGKIAVHAAKHFTDEERYLCFTEPFQSALERCGFGHPGGLPFGALLGYVTLTECRRMTMAADESKRDARVTEQERAFGNWQAGRFAWVASGDRRILESPISMKGAQGLRDLPEDAEALLLAEQSQPHPTTDGGPETAAKKGERQR
jgi:hypothetical protein